MLQGYVGGFLRLWFLPGTLNFHFVSCLFQLDDSSKSLSTKMVVSLIISIHQKMLGFRVPGYLKDGRLGENPTSFKRWLGHLCFGPCPRFQAHAAHAPFPCFGKRNWTTKLCKEKKRGGGFKQSIYIYTLYYSHSHLLGKTCLKKKLTLNKKNTPAPLRKTHSPQKTPWRNETKPPGVFFCSWNILLIQEVVMSSAQSHFDRQQRPTTHLPGRWFGDSRREQFFQYP